MQYYKKFINKYQDNLYYGNIMQRTWMGNYNIGTNICLYRKKENVLLYKTENGSFVEFDSLVKNAFLALSQKGGNHNIELPSDLDIYNENIVMPALHLNGEEDSIFGLFIDEDSITSYKEKMVPQKHKAKTTCHSV